MRKMRFQRILLGLTALAVIAGGIYLTYDRIIVYAFAKSNNLDISYKSLSRSGVDLIFKGLKATSKDAGLGIEAGAATISPKPKGCDFKLAEVRFLEVRGATGESSYQDLAGLIKVPFKGSWVYREITGKVEIGQKAITVKSLDAASDDIKLRLAGTFQYDNNVDIDVTIYFGRGVMTKIPPELSSIVMTDTGDGWKSLSVHLAGNYNEPSIQLSSKLFRLSIKSVVEK